MLTPNQVTSSDLKAFNASWKELSAHGDEVNKLIEQAETSMVRCSQIGQEGYAAIGIIALFVAMSSIASLVKSFTKKNEDFIDLFKKYSNSTLKNLPAVNTEKFSGQSINGYKYDRFKQLGNALIKIGAFVDANIGKLTKEEVIWNESIFPDMRISIVGNDIHAPINNTDMNPGWEKNTVNNLGWSVEKLSGIVPLVKAILAMDTKFDQNVWYNIHAASNGVHDEQRALHRMRTDDERQESEKQLIVVRKNFYNFRYVIQIYMYFSTHLLAQFFALCNKAQKSIK